jgi:hypothetical protein
MRACNFTGWTISYQTRRRQNAGDRPNDIIGQGSHGTPTDFFQLLEQWGCTTFALEKNIKALTDADERESVKCPKKALDRALALRFQISE